MSMNQQTMIWLLQVKLRAERHSRSHGSVHVIIFPIGKPSGEVEAASCQIEFESADHLAGGMRLNGVRIRIVYVRDIHRVVGHSRQTVEHISLRNGIGELHRSRYSAGGECGRVVGGREIAGADDAVAGVLI